MLVRRVGRRVMGLGDASNRPTHGPKDSVDDWVNWVSCTLIYRGEPSLSTFLKFNLVLFPRTFVLRSYCFWVSSRLSLLLGQLKATYSLVPCFCELMCVSLSVYFWRPVLYAVLVVWIGYGYFNCTTSNTIEHWVVLECRLWTSTQHQHNGWLPGEH